MNDRDNSREGQQYRSSIEQKRQQAKDAIHQTSALNVDPQRVRWPVGGPPDAKKRWAVRAHEAVISYSYELYPYRFRHDKISTLWTETLGEVDTARINEEISLDRLKQWHQRYTERRKVELSTTAGQTETTERYRVLLPLMITEAAFLQLQDISDELGLTAADEDVRKKYHIPSPENQDYPDPVKDGIPKPVENERVGKSSE